MGRGAIGDPAGASVRRGAIMVGHVAHHACGAVIRLTDLGDDQDLRAPPAIAIGQVKALDCRDGNGPTADLRHSTVGHAWLKAPICGMPGPSAMAIGHLLAAVGLAQQVRISGSAGAGQIRPTALVRWRPVDQAAIARRIVRSVKAGQPAHAGWAKAIRTAAAHRVINPLWPWFRQENAWAGMGLGEDGRLDAGDNGHDC
ncbi:hypothetical protein [Paracoccus marcusii]|uniref:hypothetical protein n=1 Tax=Paracoccus marcusii TaxID=59779 RepID=UPI003262F64A